MLLAGLIQSDRHAQVLDDAADTERANAKSHRELFNVVFTPRLPRLLDAGEGRSGGRATSFQPLFGELEDKRLGGSNPTLSTVFADRNHATK